MIHFEPKELTIPKVHQLLLGGIAPRPIALVSTLAEDGTPNLSPFSFFNVFSANPPIVAFSAARRGKDASLKDTYNNLVATNECVIQSVTYSMVEQVNLASTEFDTGVNEFIKSGLTPVNSDIIKPFRVKESPFQMECKLQKMIHLGDGGASGNLAICEVVKFHIAEDIFENGIIQPQLIDLVSRMSADYYCRASGDSVFVVRKPIGKDCIGYENIPDFVKYSNHFSGNELGKLGNFSKIPDANEAMQLQEKYSTQKIEAIEISREAFKRYETKYDYELMLHCFYKLETLSNDDKKSMLIRAAKTALMKEDVEFAWKIILLTEKLFDK